MKKKQKTVLQLTVARKKKKTPAHVVAARNTVRRNRPLHHRVALQPITVLALLCIGVLLCAFTFNALADTVTVNASIPAPPLTQAATITSPQNGMQTSNQAMVVSGTCPDNSYVSLLDNGIFVGAGTCDSGVFKISLDLSAGTNQLQAQDYNVTNSPGPTSSPVTVAYIPGTTTTTETPTTPITAPAVKTPIAIPVLLQVTQVDLSIPYISSSLTPIVSYQPTLTGIAPPYSYISIAIHSTNYMCTTYATAQGYWSCRFPSALTPGTYTLTVTAKTPQGTILTIPSFDLRVIGAAPPTLPIPQPFHITANYTYSLVNIGQTVSYTVHIIGGRAPYAFTIDWGDGTNQTIIRQTADDLAISHAYSWVNASLGSKIVRIQAVDATGQSSTLQLDTLVRNPAYTSAIAHATRAGGLWNFFTGVRPWLWIIWPGYAVTILLVLSFWLGERQELIQLINKGRLAAKTSHHHGHR